jgi:hypothetical protein
MLMGRAAVSDADAWILGGEPLASSAFGELETRLYEATVRSNPSEVWRRVTLGRFAVRHAAWLEAGKLPKEFGRLADAVFVVRLLRAGRRIEECSEARIRHGNCGRPRDLAGALRPFGRGQAVWRERCETGKETEFLPPLPDWSERTRWSPRLARNAVRVRLRAAGTTLRVTLDAGLPLPDQKWKLSVFFNGYPMSRSGDGRFAVRRSAFGAGEQLLSFACPPYRPSDHELPDRRELGIALFALRFDSRP